MFSDEEVVDFSAATKIPPRRTQTSAKRERAVIKAIMDGLRSRGYQPVKNHGSIYARRGRPDIEVLIALPDLPYAVLFAIEVKRPGGAPTPQQAARIEAYRKQGTVAFVAESWAQVRCALDFHIGERQALLDEKLKGGESCS